MNGTQSKNVFWKVEGAVNINNYSTFRGTLVSNNGALGAINTGVMLDGRALTTNGALTTTAITAIMPAGCTKTGLNVVQTLNDAVTIAPNPIGVNTTITINDANKVMNYNLKVYNALGKEIINTILTQHVTTLDTKELHSGIYFYKVMDNNKLIQSGKLISNQ